MRFLLAFVLFAATLNARAATYLLLSQTNAFAAGITNAAQTYANTRQLGSANLTNWSALPTNALGAAAPVGTVVTNSALATGDIYAVGAAPTNAVKATSPNLQAALGNVYQATNATLTAVSTNTTTGTGRVVLESAVAASQTNVAAANPTATVATTAVNGSALTFMRSDAAPAIPASFITANQTNATLASLGGVTTNAPAIAAGSPAVFVSSNVLGAATSANLSNAIGSSVFVPIGGGTMTGPLSIAQGATITNSATTQVGLTVNGFAGQTNDLANFNSGGTNFVKVSSTGALLASDGSAANPSIGWINDADGSGTGMYRTAANQIQFVQNGSATMLIQNQQITLNGITLSFSNVGFLGTDGTGTFQFGQDAASPVAQSLKSCDGSGTDKAGGTMTLEGGQSTGAGVPGDLIYRTALYTNSSGTAANAYTERGRIVGRPSALTNNAATTFQQFTLATNTYAGINLFCTVNVRDAAFALQSISSSVRVDAVNVNGTITGTVSTTDNTLAASTGTLTVAYTVADAGSNVLALKCNANSSLTGTNRIKWIIQSINSDGAVTVTPTQL